MEHIRVSQCVLVSVCCSGSSGHTQTGWQGGRTVKQGGRRGTVKQGGRGGAVKQGGRGGGLSNRVAGGTVAHRQWITEGI